MRRKKYELCSGQSFLIRPNSLIQYYPDPDDLWEYAWIDIDGNGVEKLIDEIKLFQKKPIAPIINGELRKLFTNVCETSSESTSAEFYRHLGTFYLIISCYCDLIPTESRAVRDDIVTAARVWVAMNLHNPAVTVESLAKSLNVSRVTLYRKFREYLSASPNKYICEQRLEKAGTLLKSARLSVKNIAYSVGFEDPLYFSKVFHGKYGITPTEYRK